MKMLQERAQDENLDFALSGRYKVKSSLSGETGKGRVGG